MTEPPHQKIQLWIVREGAEQDLLQQYLALVDCTELVRYQRLLFAVDKSRFLQTRAAIRTILSEYHPEIAPADWQFRNNAWGRPEATNQTRQALTSFNISHTRGLIVIATTSNGSAGVDVENIRTPRRTLEVARRYFSDSEFSALAQLPPEQQAARFFSLWTLKEAYIKACGMGLAIPLRHFSFSFPEADRIRIAFARERNDDPARWSFWQYAAGEDFVLAVALRDDHDPVQKRILVQEITPMHQKNKIELELLSSSQGLSAQNISAGSSV